MKTSLLWAMMCLVPLLAQQPSDAPKPPPPAPRNLKILKPEQIRPVMGAFRTALGVQCSHCHVQGDMASDEKPQKEMARKMMAMTSEINGNFPQGKQHVTCFTCHRGAVEPATAPEPNAAGAPSGERH